jgi:hypothetical protein
MIEIPKYTLAVLYHALNPDEIWSVSLGAYGNVKDLTMSGLPEYVYERVALLRLTEDKEKGVIGRKLNEFMFTIYLTHDEYKELNSLPSP